MRRGLAADGELTVKNCIVSIMYKWLNSARRGLMEDKAHAKVQWCLR